MTPELEVLLVFTTFPSRDIAREVGAKLVDERLIACINLLPQAESIYRWKGAIERGEETIGLMKTTREGYPALERRFKELHPYEVPELVAISLASGLPEYLAWVCESTARE